MAYQPSPSRLEAFSDGVIAVIITIMVLELKVPRADGLPGLRALVPTLAVYLLSFAFTGIYWVNHHHLIDRLRHVDHLILWSNLGFLFFLSLLPFFTNYMMEKGLNAWSVAIYVGSLLATGISFTLLQKSIGRHLRRQEAEKQAEDLALQDAEVLKARLSLAIYTVAILLAWVRPWLGLAASALVTVLWIVPTLGLERRD